MVHYVGLKTFEDISKIDDILSDVDNDRMIEMAYDVVVKRHTHFSRAKKILKIYDEIKTQQFYNKMREKGLKKNN